RIAPHAAVFRLRSSGFVALANAEQQGGSGKLCGRPGRLTFAFPVFPQVGLHSSLMTDTLDGRLLVIGDVHGCDVALDVLLDRLELTADDWLVVLGDVIDRGPGSRA